MSDVSVKTTRGTRTIENADKVWVNDSDHLVIERDSEVVAMFASGEWVSWTIFGASQKVWEVASD